MEYLTYIVWFLTTILPAKVGIVSVPGAVAVFDPSKCCVNVLDLRP